MFYLILKISLALAMLLPMAAHAQMEIDSDPIEQTTVVFKDSIIWDNDINVEYYSFSHARHKLKLKREERNALEVNAGLQGSFSAMNNSWQEATGGDNTLLLRFVFSLNHTFTKNIFTLTSQASAKFGYYGIDDEDDANGDGSSKSIWYKDQDEFQLSIAPSFKMTKNWSYGSLFKFRSQFADGYYSQNSQESYNLMSTFLSPGYLDISVGFTYNCPKKGFPVKIYLSPLALSATYVTSAEVRENAQYQYGDPESNTYTYLKPYGVSPSKSSLYEGGSSVQIDFDRYFGKNDFLRYNTTLYTFYGWMAQLSSHSNKVGSYDEYSAAMSLWEADPVGEEPFLNISPTVRWENTITIKASKYLSTMVNLELYYNRAQGPEVQLKSVLSLGVSYTFKNK
ncbi:MAG: DUF3078 domain-containing protein [Rikenellaceae bacterium]